ncbi:GH92 family glycosyl hydrolase [uncultured Paludibaculum sp.]|uniref:GH92 family glycosyl hydrolase n=1 Tax=uncultured Paludibaculum sp. TaxID=1765020 RepID=UPI002AABD743|nr:GH92 family glycosyl hydrolase [uncultured Paludibaculum sp.]
MTRFLLPFLLIFTCAGADRLADLPDPLVGTDSKYELSRGNTYPAIFMPYAMAAWTAQTGEGGWPYQYAKDNIRGFRMTHRPSAWTIDWGSFSLMPGTGPLKVLSDERGSKFRHANETARAYRYDVLLDDYQTRVSMAPTAHGGILRFTFPKTGPAWVVLDANKGGSSVHIHPESNRITGTNSLTAKGSTPGFALYFVAEFDHPFSTFGTWNDKGEKDTAKDRTGPHTGAYVGFQTANGEVVTVRVGTSLISLEQAEKSLKEELPKADIEAAAEAAARVWDHDLATIELQGGTADQRRTFYTALYHSLQFPRMLDETGAGGATVHYGLYDGKVHPGPMFTDIGFWDVFRAQFPLLTVINPSRNAEIMRAMVNTYEEGGWIPTWPNPIERNVMIGTHADSAVADAYLKGIRGFDAEKAYAAIRKDGAQPGTGVFDARLGIEDYLKLGYVPADGGVRESAARTLEYAYDDFCIAQMARALGKQDDYQRFMKQAKSYRNLYDPSTGFMRGRNRDGSWLTPFDPLDWGGVFTEGNAWQWLWSVQHDIPGLIELMGGRDAFIKKLDTLFSTTTDFKVGGYKQVIHEMTEAKLGDMGQYAHINEPVHHVIYLYDYVGQPWKAQKWASLVMERNYKPGPAGWLGDEDNGQMSAWYIFTALGFYPVNPGQPIYALGSPLFQRATIRLENGKKFTVETQRKSAGDIYVQSVTLNGRPHERPWISHNEIVSGGTLRFRMGPQPNEKWGTSGLPTPDETFAATKSH